jgi:hypothetical protein
MSVDKGFDTHEQVITLHTLHVYKVEHLWCGQGSNMCKGEVIMHVIRHVSKNPIENDTFSLYIVEIVFPTETI